MIEIGRTNRLTVIKRVGGKIYLGTGRSALVSLADRRLPDRCRTGDVVDVFVYVDPEGHLAATAAVPKAQAGDVAWLQAVSVNYYGAFLEWGLSWDLRVPSSEQREKMKVGRHYLVKLLLDAGNRIIATAKIDPYLSEESSGFTAGQPVSLLIAAKTELGYKAVINNGYWGVLYRNELFRHVEIGQRLDGYIKRIRDDKKIDLTLYRPGYGKVEALADIVLIELKKNGGRLPLSDNSPPESIYAAFGVSKKAFKQAIGALYKKKLIDIDDGGIRLLG